MSRHHDEPLASFLTDTYLSWARSVINERGFMVQIHAPNMLEPHRPVLCYTVGLTEHGLPELALALNKADWKPAADTVRRVATHALAGTIPLIAGPLPETVTGSQALRLSVIDDPNDRRLPLLVATRLYNTRSKPHRVRAMQIILDGIRSEKQQPRIGQNVLARLAH